MIKTDIIRGWVFDIDDTLYLERDYVLSGFRAVGHWAENALGIIGFADQAIALFREGVRGNTFDIALQRTGYPASPEIVGEMIRQYREHIPTIHLEPDAAALLAHLQNGTRIGVITDGPEDSQRRKARALNLHSIASPVIFTDAWGIQFRKPHSRAFEEIQETWRLRGEELIYVADNPLKDFRAPSALGWQTARIVRPDSQHAGVPVVQSEITAEISSLDELHLPILISKTTSP
jgi:putative hydrolase of the HAD superfamily